MAGAAETQNQRALGRHVLCGHGRGLSEAGVDEASR